MLPIVTIVIWAAGQRGSMLGAFGLVGLRGLVPGFLARDITDNNVQGSTQVNTLVYITF